MKTVRRGRVKTQKMPVWIRRKAPVRNIASLYSNRPEGYTIIEIMIVLTVTGVLFTSAVLMFRGQQGSTSLSQSLYDISSKIESYASQVSSGVYPDSQSYTCSLDGTGHAVLTGGSGGNGTNQNCLFLGRAIQVIPNSISMYAYSVLGDSTYHNGAVDTGQTTTSFDQASSTPALGASGSWLLYEQYDLPSNENFVSSKVTDINGNVYNNYNLVGLYIDLNTSSTLSNTTALSIRAYNFPNGGVNTPTSANLKSCIQQNAPCAAGSYVNVKDWVVCVQDGNNKGMITITSTAGGLTTAVNAQECA